MAEATKATIYPVILSGGVGSRLWPLSRALHPKQLIALCSEQTMVQDTADRVRGPSFADPIVVCNDAHRFMVAQQLRDIGIENARIILEPVGRNTAPAIALAALVAQSMNPDATILVLPSDHVINDTGAFHSAVATAIAGAGSQALATFGIKPDRPETGYGYIKAGMPQSHAQGWHPVDAFKEKPDVKTALAYIAAGDCFWNSGMFLLPVKLFLQELEKFAPDVLAGATAALETAERDLDFIRVAEAPFATCPSIPIDTAVMEQTSKAIVVPADLGWNDLGSWRALWDVGEKDSAGNLCSGDVIVVDSDNSLLRTDRQLLAAIGLKDLVVVATDDAILVADKDHVQDVKVVVDQLKAAGRNEAMIHRLVYRPWGSYRTIDQGKCFQVKQIMVNPGGVLSLQMHHRRAEHWVVVEGTAKVVRGDEEFLLYENQSTFIPIGTRHRLENQGETPLRLIEVQSGDYLGEDDIVRFEDIYGREKSGQG